MIDDALGPLEIIIILLIILMIIRVLYNVRKLFLAKKDIESRRKTVRDGKIVDNEDAEK